MSLEMDCRVSSSSDTRRDMRPVRRTQPFLTDPAKTVSSTGGIPHFKSLWIAEVFTEH